MNEIYLDNAATTRVHPNVIDAMLPFYHTCYGNASSGHGLGRRARKALEEARESVAQNLGADPKEIVFTSGATESDNMAIVGMARALRSKGNHIVTSSIEHSAVLESCRALEREGFRVTYLPVGGDGAIDPAEFAADISKETILASIMYANNETGVVQPIGECAKSARDRGVLFHTDAVQAIGKIPIDVKKMGIDMLSLSAHKIHGPKGSGGLYIARGLKPVPLIYGGGHEFEKRAGTQNVASAVGLATALSISHDNLAANVETMERMRQRLLDGIVRQIAGVHINGNSARRIPNILNVSFEYAEGEAVILSLDTYAICVSAGSACASDSMEPSHVLTAMGVSRNLIKSSIRFSMSRETTEEEIDVTLQRLPEVIQRLRDISPLYRKGGGEKP